MFTGKAGGLATMSLEGRGGIGAGIKDADFWETQENAGGDS